MTEPAAEEMPPAPEPPVRRAYRGLATGLAAVAIVLIAAVATAPFWAPKVVPLLPWSAAAMGPDPELLQRLGRLEAAYDQQRQEAAQRASTLEQLGRRVAALETNQSKDQQAGAKAAAAAQQLEPRIAALEAREKQDEQTNTGSNARLKQLDNRIATLESRPETSAQDIAGLRQQIDKLSSTNTDLSARTDALEKGARTGSPADPTDAGLVLALLQIRDAIQTARPFSAEYDALAALGRNRPEIAETAALLAEPAKRGVASRAVLAKRLHELAGSIANAEAPAAEADWGSEALARLRGLVTIRRVGGAGQSGPEAAVSAAEAALASGDLAGAIAALDKLNGAPAEAARPWLRMARQRLAVEEALRRIETLLVARLGKGADPAAAAAPPG